MRGNEAGVEIGRPERLGQAIHRIKVGIGKQRAQAPHERTRQRAARIGQPAQRSARTVGPVELDELDPQRRHAGERRDRPPGDRFHDVTRREIVERDTDTARIPGRKQLVLAIIEAQRQDAQRPVVGRKAEIMRHRLGAEPEVGVAQHDALGLSRRAAGVKDRGNIVGRGRRLRDPVTGRGDHRGKCIDIDAGAVAIGAVERGETRPIRQQQPRAAVDEDMRDLSALEQRVDRDVDQARARRGERHQACLRRLGEPGRDTIAGDKPMPAQDRRHRRHAVLDCCKFKRFARRFERDRACRAAPHQAVNRLRCDG